MNKQKNRSGSLWALLKMRFFSGSIVGDVLADPKHSLRSRGQLSSCMAYTLRCCVRRRLTTTEKSLFLEAPLCSLSLMAVCLSCLSANTHAQSPALEEIIVTAERKAASLQDVPLAISAFTANELESRQIDEPSDIIDFIPNLSGSNNTGLGTANAYFLRGIGNTESIATFDPPVGTYVDDVYIARQNGNNVALFDVERVEVLRGPQGTLFGRNTTGGAVAVYAKKPNEEFGGFVEMGFGDFDRVQARGTVNIPVSENVLTKISAFRVDGDGYVNNLTTGDRLNGEDSAGIRADLRVKSENLFWDLSLEYIKDESTNIVNAFDGQSVFQVPPSSNSSTRYSRTGIRVSESDGSAEQLSRGEGLGNNNESVGITSTLSWTLDSGNLTWIASYRDLSQDFILDFFDGPGPVGGFTIANQGDHEQISQELKFTSDSLFENLSLVAGLYYFTEDNDTDLTDVFAVPSGNLVLADRLIENDLDTVAIYAQGDYALSDKLTLTLGGRFTREEKTVEFTDTKNDLSAAGLPNLLVSPTAPGALINNTNLAAAGIPTEQEENEFTPRIAIQYTPSEDLMLFASATRGFKSGGWNARATAPTEALAFAPEKVWSYEAGFRSEWLDNRLRINATAFFMDVEDFQVPSAFVRDNGSIAFITQNFADLENKGLEFEITAVPVEGLNLYAAVGIQNGEQQPAQPIQDQVAQCLIDGTGAGLGIVDPNCNIADPTRTPDLTFNIGGNYLVAVSDRVSVQPSLNLRYVDEQNISTTGVPAALADSYTNLNAGVTVTLDENLSLVAECNNCTNDVVQTSLLAGTLYYNEPRRYNLRVKYEF